MDDKRLEVETNEYGGRKICESMTENVVRVGREQEKQKRKKGRKKKKQCHLLIGLL